MRESTAEPLPSAAAVKIYGRKSVTAKSSAPAPHRPPQRAMIGQRSRPHPEPRRQRRRYVMKRRPATPADFLRRIHGPQPLSPGNTLRVQTLHRPTGQILHRPHASLIFFTSAAGRGDARRQRPVQLVLPRKAGRDCAPDSLVCQGKCTLLVGVSLQSRQNCRACCAPTSWSAAGPERSRPKFPFWYCLFSCYQTRFVLPCPMPFFRKSQNPSPDHRLPPLPASISPPDPSPFLRSVGLPPANSDRYTPANRNRRNPYKTNDGGTF
jgi:hypothetical protein